MTKSLYCEIRVKGHLSSQWEDWFAGLEVKNLPDAQALLCGYLPDQAALYGVLKNIGNLGVALASLNCVERSQPIRGKNVESHI